MGLSHITRFTLFLFLATTLSAQEINVQTLSDGACWYEQGEYLRLASFNDKESLMISRDEIEIQLESLLGLKQKNRQLVSDLALHCGAYGSSFVLKAELEGKATCLWLKINRGKLGIRSAGGLENSKNDICDGYKWGELLVGLKGLEQLALLESPRFQNVFESVKVISGTTVKLVLKKEFYGKEISVMEELKKLIDLRYIELNLYQHPAGEAASLK